MADARDEERHALIAAIDRAARLQRAATVRRLLHSLLHSLLRGRGGAGMRPGGGRRLAMPRVMAECSG